MHLNTCWIGEDRTSLWPFWMVLLVCPLPFSRDFQQSEHRGFCRAEGDAEGPFYQLHPEGGCTLVQRSGQEEAHIST